MDTIKDVLIKNMATIKESEQTAAPVKDEAGKTESVKPSTDSKPDVKSDKPEEDVKKKHDYQSRINAKHAEAMKYKEEAEKERQEKTELLKRIESLEKSTSPKSEKKSLETVEELEAYLEKVATKDDVEALFSKMFNEHLTKARENVEKETKQQALDRMTNEFSSELYKFYNPKDESDFELDNETREEAVEIVNLFQSRPDFYLDKVKKYGVNYLRKFVTGELEAETKADTLKKLVLKADAVKTNMDSSNNVKPYEQEDKPRTFKNVFEAGLKKLTKGA